ncbi:hypothetical protein [Desulfonatronum thioautotrophicum]|uniref:hypothetical protein n=1 Tax=Desulfonatronum thioautotrophicum TaxID=617001 RepID=UPI0005EB02C9|nr:hypothetical protein [Desulfonatronum thioautotrophicum]
MDMRKKARLMNCLQTILEVESQLHRLRETDALVTELTSLRTLIRELELEQTRLEEMDVQRIELATTIFLQELEIHFQCRETEPLADRLLH